MYGGSNTVFVVGGEPVGSFEFPEEVYASLTVVHGNWVVIVDSLQDDHYCSKYFTRQPSWSKEIDVNARFEILNLWNVEVESKFSSFH